MPHIPFRQEARGHVVEIALSIASVAYGALLGVFLLGTLTRYATQTGAILGMIVGFALNLVLFLQSLRLLPNPAGPLHLPAIAFTWYVFLGALATFAVGTLASLVFNRQSLTKAAVTGVMVLVAVQAISQSTVPETSFTPDFTPITTLVNEAVAAKKLPGAVVIVGHSGKVVFEHAYGERKLANEPGLDEVPSPGETMTEDTLFDMASLSKCLSTATAIMQLYEQGKIGLDDPIQKYLPSLQRGQRRPARQGDHPHDAHALLRRGSRCRPERRPLGTRRTG